MLSVRVKRVKRAGLTLLGETVRKRKQTKTICFVKARQKAALSFKQRHFLKSGMFLKSYSVFDDFVGCVSKFRIREKGTSP